MKTNGEPHEPFIPTDPGFFIEENSIICENYASCSGVWIQGCDAVTCEGGASCSQTLIKDSGAVTCEGEVACGSSQFSGVKDVECNDSTCQNTVILPGDNDGINVYCNGNSSNTCANTLSGSDSYTIDAGRSGFIYCSGTGACIATPESRAILTLFALCTRCLNGACDANLGAVDLSKSIIIEDSSADSNMCSYLSNFTSLSAFIEAKNDETDALEEEVGTLEKEISSQKSEIRSLNSKVTTLNTRINTLTTKLQKCNRSSCRSIGAPCSANAACCSNRCAKGSCRKACKKLRTSCTRSRQCCSKKCVKRKCVHA